MKLWNKIITKLAAKQIAEAVKAEEIRKNEEWAPILEERYEIYRDLKEAQKNKFVNICKITCEVTQLCARYDEITDKLDAIHADHISDDNEAFLIDEKMKINTKIEECLNALDQFMDREEMPDYIVQWSELEENNESERPTTIGHVQHLHTVIMHLDEITRCLEKFNSYFAKPGIHVFAKDIEEEVLITSAILKYETINKNSGANYSKNVEKGEIKLSKDEFITIVTYLRETYINELALHGIKYNYSTRS